MGGCGDCTTSLVMIIARQHREKEEALKADILRVISTIRSDKNMQRAIALMIRKGLVTPEEMIAEFGNGFMAKVVIDGLEGLGVQTGFQEPVVLQVGTSFSICPFWLETLQQFDKRGWDSVNFEVKFKSW